MKVCIPTLKFTDHSRDVVYNKVYCITLNEEQLSAINMSASLIKSINQMQMNEDGVIDRGFVGGHRTVLDYCVHVECIDEAHHYGGKNLEFLQTYGIKMALGWLLPIDKAPLFMRNIKYHIF